MSLKYLSIPTYLKPEAYEDSVRRMIKVLSQEKTVKAVYRMGNVNHPGISDLDLIVVFENDAECLLDPTKFYTDTDRYIFTHNLAGASESFFQMISPYTFWDNLDCIWGKEIQGLEKLSPIDSEKVKQQTALEYMLKNYLELTIQKTYGVLKLRSIFQELKAIRYDLAFLNITEGAIYQSIQDFLTMLDQWFDNSFKTSAFEQWLDEYCSLLQEVLNDLVQSGQLVWLPKSDSYQYGRNVTIHYSNQMNCKFKGFTLPSYILQKGKKWYNANLRLNHFDCGIPFTNEDPDGLFKKRLEVFQAYKLYNREKLPHFEAMAFSLTNRIV